MDEGGLATVLEEKAADQARPLRVGIVLSSPDDAPPWAAHLVERLVDDDLICVAALIVAKEDRRSRKRASALYHAMRRLDRALFGRSHPQAPLAEVSRGTPRLPLSGSEEDLARLRDLDLDLLIELEPTRHGSKVRALTTFGGWSFDFCLNAAARDDTVGFWEAFRRRSLTPVALVHLPRQGGSRLVAAVASFNTKFSGARNESFVKARSISLMIREARRLARSRRFDDTALLPFQDPGEQAPSTIDAIAYGAHLIGNLCARAIQLAFARLGLRSDMWAVYLGRGSAPFVDLKATRKLEPPRGQAMADPFLWREGDETFLFYERLIYRNNRAVLSVGRIDGDRFEFIGDVSDSDLHLSYPFIFRHEGQLYLMPEVYQADRVEVWRCTEFPLKWELHATALEGRSPCDSSLFHDGKDWWLFTNLTSKFHMDHCSELHVFKVDGPDLKSVTPHELNPVVVGSEFARNGGRMLLKDGKIYRPAQCNSFGVYGYGLSMMEITELSLSAFREHRVAFYPPDFRPKLFALHHMDSAGDLFVVDACQRFGGLGPAPGAENRFI